MKKIPVLGVIILLVSCQSKQADVNMPGAYSLTKQVLNDGAKDSSLDRGQLKIYTGDYMMYASPNLTDSFANFGIGKYRVENGKVVEKVFYRANTGPINDSLIVNIEKTNSGYKQVIDAINIEGKNYKLFEEYDNVSVSSSSPLDGAWKQIKNIYITAKGDSSVNNNPLEYKIFHSGHFIWGITSKDSANKTTSVYGYGKFEMLGDNKTKETVISSTFQKGLVGRTYEVDIQKLGDNSYQQTITFANGDKSIEIYEKLT